MSTTVVPLGLIFFCSTSPLNVNHSNSPLFAKVRASVSPYLVSFNNNTSYAVHSIFSHRWFTWYCIHVSAFHFAVNVILSAGIFESAVYKRFHRYHPEKEYHDLVVIALFKPESKSS